MDTMWIKGPYFLRKSLKPDMHEHFEPIEPEKVRPEVTDLATRIEANPNPIPMYFHVQSSTVRAAHGRCVGTYDWSDTQNIRLHASADQTQPTNTQGSLYVDGRGVCNI